MEVKKSKKKGREKRQRKAQLAATPPATIIPVADDLAASLRQISETLDLLVSKVDALSKQRREPSASAIEPLQTDDRLADKCRTTVRQNLGRLICMSRIEVGKSGMANFGFMDSMMDQAFVADCFEETKAGGPGFSSLVVEKAKQKGLLDNVSRALADKYISALALHICRDALCVDSSASRQMRLSWCTLASTGVCSALKV